jgi:hypothetical protein
MSAAMSPLLRTCGGSGFAVGGAGEDGVCCADGFEVVESGLSPHFPRFAQSI